MFPLFESICVLDGKIKNAEFHERRFQFSHKKFYWKEPKFQLFDAISIPLEFQKGKVKLRISYNDTGSSISFQQYRPKKIELLQLVHDSTIAYDLKFKDRAALNKLLEQRGGCDDVLIIKNGLITDTSYSNIAFYDGEDWATPSSPLLNGTKRAQLLAKGLLYEREITARHLHKFKGFQLINAMLDFDPGYMLPVRGIRSNS